MKTLQDLTLLDNFLFTETMAHPEVHSAALQIILGQERLELLTAAQTEKVLATAPWLRSIRLDVYALDQDHTVYNTEMQAKHRTDLVRRSRYYQSLIDSSLLEKGTVSFNTLNDACIIMITPFDLFGKGKYCYTFIPCCKESKDIELEDGAVRIFLNTRGTNDHEVSQDLIDFLHYVESTDGELAQRSSCEQLKRIHSFVSQIKASEEMGVKYMQKLEEKILLQQEAQAEGRAEGLVAGILLCAQNLMANMGIPATDALTRVGVPKDELAYYLSRIEENASSTK
ncbi:MAG: Rpn family recombination-promoting nuclease/putative transposase [Lachnospiraceae bacterium]|nr:Rpn family recombination-promoting nuclease/putative transposase [Lachnospiraceae bacterium]